jgi:ATP-dependent protease ClpP protease subunit
MTTKTDRLQQLHAKVGGRISGALAAVPSDSNESAGAGGHAELWLYGVVGGFWWGFDAEDVAYQLRGLDVETITVRLHSPGGNVFEGIAIANLLRNHKAQVTVVVDGLAASAASLIAIAADHEVVMSPGSQLMLHDAWSCVCGNEKELRQVADWIGKQAQNMAEQYALRAGGAVDSWRAVMTAEPDGTWYTANEAVAAKLADRVGTIVAASPPPAPPDQNDDIASEGDDLEASARWGLDVLQLHPAALAAWGVGPGRKPSGAPKPPTASAGGKTQPEGAAVVDLNDEQITALREQVGFPADADADTIVAAVTEALSENASDDTPPTPLTTPTVPEGMVLVEAGVFQQVQADAALGRTAQETLAGQERDRAINQALKDGKIAATSREKFVEAWDKDATSTKAILDALTPGLVPIEAAGHESEPQALGEDIQIDDAELEAFASGFGLTKEDLRG